MNTKTQQAVDFIESNGQLSPIFELLVRGYSSTLIISFKGYWFFYFCCTFWIPWYPIVVSHLRSVYTDSRRGFFAYSWLSVSTSGFSSHYCWRFLYGRL